MNSSTSTISTMPSPELFSFLQSPDGVVLADIGGHVQFVNPAFLRAFGLTEAEGAKAWQHVFGLPDSTNNFQRSVWSALNESGEWKGLLPNDKPRTPSKSWFLTISTVRAADGHRLGYLALAVDFTERLELESQMARNETSARVAEGALAVVQEIRSPLEDILLNISVLEIYAEDAVLGQHWSDAERATIHLITKEAQRLEAVVKGVTNYVRNVELRYAEVPIAEFLEDIRGMLQAPARRRNVHLTVEPDRSNLTGRFDPDRMQQAVLGLMQDAVETAEQGSRPSILLRAQEKRDPSWHSISFNDRALVFEILGSGPARSSNAQRDLFQPSFTGNASEAARNLAASAKIIRQHHGLLDIQPAGIQPFSTMYTIALPM